MNIIIADSYDAMSQKAADLLLDSVHSIEKPLICAASGDSPAGLYKALIRYKAEKKTDFSKYYFVGLDEWYGMNQYDEGSCKFHLDQQLFGPLGIAADRICFFDGRQEDPKKECERIEQFVTEHGPIDCAVVGLGMNGHVGMNEPGTNPSLRAHLADIALETQQVGQKYFKQPRELTKGLTMGIENLMEAKKVILVVSGSKKAAVVKKVIEAEVSESIPATLLRRHPDFHIFLDRQAAELLRS